VNRTGGRGPGRAGAAREAAARHDDRRRSFPQLAPRTGDDGRFAATWWGNAWVEALENTALDTARLARGKAYAGRGHVDAITVTPGRGGGGGRRPRPPPPHSTPHLR
jgi:hypothetical protein